jgi:hypothetical protein
MQRNVGLKFSLVNCKLFNFEYLNLLYKKNRIGKGQFIAKTQMPKHLYCRTLASSYQGLSLARESLTEGEASVQLTFLASTSLD